MNASGLCTVTSLGSRSPRGAVAFSRIAAFFALISFLLIIPIAAPLSAADNASQAGEKVVVIEVHDTIDLGLAFFIKRSLDNADERGAEAIILDINTFGGRVDAAVDIRDALDRCEIPTTAYVNMRAISAGALICLAADDIAMAPGSTIGAATPVGMGGAGEKLELGEKEKSYVRGEFRATAERNGHSPLLAEAMVDPDTEAWVILGGKVPKIVSEAEAKVEKKAETKVVSAKGKLLTMTASEAVEAGLAGSTPASLDELVNALGFDPAEKIVSKISWSEYIVRFLTNPIVSGLLLTLGVLGIFFELQMPGWGVSGTIGITFLLLFFGGHYLAGLASALDLLLFVIGIALIAAEIFVVPGFGITGISGVICILLGIYLALVKKPIPQFSWDYEMLNTAMVVFVVFIVAGMAGIMIIWKMSPESRIKKLMVLSESLRTEDGYAASDNLASLVGQTGKSITHLRPAGRALINGEPFEVQSEGDFIEIDRALTVLRVAGNKVFVAETEKGEEA
jgi:membrane-bound serine protease (ClpP class)